MNQKSYQKLVDTCTPKPQKLKNALVAFGIGGLVGMLGQGLLDLYSYALDIPTKQASIYMIITLIIIASLFTALGFFDDWVSKAKAGLIVPITGFAHSMTSAAMEYRKEGLVTGIGANIFKLSGTVILYGVVAAYVFGLIRVLLFGG